MWINTFCYNLNFRFLFAKINNHFETAKEKGN